MVTPEVTGESADAEHRQGQAILAALGRILSQCETAGNYPGEGRERAFRGWLVSDLLIGVLGWPAEHVVAGERFDVLVKDGDGFPVSTIETKAPHHAASPQEHADFESRLAGYGTLRTAYFTNSDEWERLEIFAPTGTLEIRGRVAFRLSSATAEEAEAFFAPLVAARYLAAVQRSTRHAVSQDHPHILAEFAADLHRTVGDLAAFLYSFLDGVAGEHYGAPTRGIALNLFDLWCDKSLVVSPQHAAARLVVYFQKNHDGTARELAAAVADAGLSAAATSAATEALAPLTEAARLDVAAVKDALWPAYAEFRKNFCAQTAHVVLARALLYRIGEDQGLFQRVLSGTHMQNALAARASAVVDVRRPATELLAHIRRTMESFLPPIYLLGEFDWWLIPEEKRGTLTAAERAWLRQMDEDFERVDQRLLRLLDGYFFGRVDVDVWRNVYQNFLPADERQRLGGFYTPDELVNLILDLAEFEPQCEGLCQLSFIDLACGSGAFVTAALSRLLKHLELDLPCHAALSRKNLPEWKRAEAVLKLAATNLHAVDLHPFASFLTTLNVLFLLMPLYARARAKNPDFSLDLQIFSADSLEKHDQDLLTPELFAQLNARVQLTESSFHHFQELLGKRFDRLFGNPPWGGVLKGPLAPVYDSAKKDRFKREYPGAAHGKYDVYGLFMERALQVLKPTGRFGLLTQGSFVEKDWAAGLRALLATKARLRYVLDLNPFGHLFFHAMNTPCITVGDAAAGTDRSGNCMAVLSRPPADFGDLDDRQRRERVVATVKEVVAQVTPRRRAAVAGFATGAWVPHQRLRDTAGERWDLSGQLPAASGGKPWATAASILEARQGVTPGGCLELFLLSSAAATNLELEQELVYQAIKTRNVARWHVAWAGRALFYPYRVIAGALTPAFTLNLSQVRDQELRESLRQAGIRDALDFDQQLDDHERELVRRVGVNRRTVPLLLRHRTALGLVRYPNAAAYLVQNYERLEGRIFKKRNIRAFNRRWYEYLWPRDPEFVLSAVRIVSPRLAKQVRFSLDTHGYLSDDACLYLQPSADTGARYENLCKALAAALGREAALPDALQYCLAFLNSDCAQHRLVTGRRPTPKGAYAITEAFLKEVAIPRPAKRTASVILDLVGKLVTAEDQSRVSQLETGLAEVVTGALGP